MGDGSDGYGGGGGSDKSGWGGGTNTSWGGGSDKSGGGYGPLGYAYGGGYGPQGQQGQDQQAGQSQDAFAVPGQGWSTDALNSFAQAGFDPSMVTGSPATEGMTPNQVVSGVFGQMDGQPGFDPNMISPSPAQEGMTPNEIVGTIFNQLAGSSPGETVYEKQHPGAGNQGTGNQGTGGGRFTDTGNFVSGPSGGNYGGGGSPHGGSTDLQTLVNQFLSNPGNYGPVSPVPGQGWRMPTSQSASSLSSLASSATPSTTNTAAPSATGNYSMAAKPIPGVGWR